MIPTIRDLVSGGREHQVFGLVLILGLIHGLVYVFLVPPWQHYDEPGHFEYAWLLANRDGFPQPNEYDQAMRREMAASMVEHNFFKGLGFQPNLLSLHEPIWIGVTQTDDRPTYYFLVSLPLRLVRFSDVTFQLYLARLVSLALFLVAITASYGVVVALAPPGHPLRWMVPASLALLPSFVDLMTAVNNDVGATAFFSLFLLVSVRLIRQGFTWPRFVGLLAITVLCLLTKNAVAIVAVLVFVALLFSLLREHRRRYAWALLGLSVLVAFVAVFDWGDAAYWYRTNWSSLPTRSSNQHVPLGAHAIHIRQQPGGELPQLVQLLPISDVHALRGKTVTLGGWIWANEPAVVRLPTLKIDQQQVSADAEVNETPQFFAISAAIPDDALRMWVVLSPVQTALEEGLSVYFDGLLLVEGEHGSNHPPSFSSPQGYTGQWSGQSFKNLLRNASVEMAWPRVRPWADRLIRSQTPINPSAALTSLLDWRASSWYYRMAFEYIAQTFWARFGWGHVSIQGFHPYLVLGGVTLLGLAGAGTALWRNRSSLPSEMLLLMGAALIGIWAAAFWRGIYSILGDAVFIPAARYAYPAIIPTMLVLNIGWLEWIRLVHRRLRLPQKALFSIYLLFFLGLAFLSLFSIYSYYYQ